MLDDANVYEYTAHMPYLKRKDITIDHRLYDTTRVSLCKVTYKALCCRFDILKQNTVHAYLDYTYTG